MNLTLGDNLSNQMQSQMHQQFNAPQSNTDSPPQMSPQTQSHNENMLNLQMMSGQSQLLNVQQSGMYGQHSGLNSGIGGNVMKGLGDLNSGNLMGQGMPSRTNSMSNLNSMQSQDLSAQSANYGSLNNGMNNGSLNYIASINNVGSMSNVGRSNIGSMINVATMNKQRAMAGGGISMMAHSFNQASGQCIDQGLVQGSLPTSSNQQYASLSNQQSGQGLQQQTAIGMGQGNQQSMGQGLANGAGGGNHAMQGMRSVQGSSGMSTGPLNAQSPYMYSQNANSQSPLLQQQMSPHGTPMLQGSQMNMMQSRMMANSQAGFQGAMHGMQSMQGTSGQMNMANQSGHQHNMHGPNSYAPGINGQHQMQGMQPNSRMVGQQQILITPQQRAQMMSQLQGSRYNMGAQGMHGFQGMQGRTVPDHVGQLSQLQQQQYLQQQGKSLLL
jgi:hypothetical protein